ncbi:hypothetical protein JCGZ_00099 [Jatropha curcas]|uniref:Uncharacterized protein n=1 Tax=Jatropha curcas TaxID=180498 RepID=A0A067JIP0_JATCU|nr:hypothetical protein JCGZ_00099 [Jatropha curcas]
MVWMYGPGVAVSQTGSSSGHSRCGPTSTGFIPVVRGAIPQLTPGEFLGICTGDPHYWRCFLNDRALSDARLPEVREYIQERKKHRTPAYYRAQAEVEAEAEATAPAGLAGVVLGDVPFPPGMEVALDPALVPAQRYQELCRRFGFARSDIARLYSERHERDLEIGRLRRHQSRQSGAVTRLQLEVDRLRTRLEVEGIQLDFSEDEEDDGSSSDDAPPSPPAQAAAGPSRRRR